MAEITIEQIAAAGVVGAGGGGFPTSVKLSARADTVLINAAECEPLIHKDKEILLNSPDAVIAGLAAAMRLVGAERGIIGIKQKYPRVIEAMTGRLGAAMSVAPLGDTYPVGDEFILVYDVLGRICPPGGIPLDVGAVVINVETAANIAAAARGPVIEKYVSVAGAVGEPITVRAPIGAPLSACVAAAGGPTVDDPNYVVGGVMMGRLETDHDAPIDKTTGCVIVLGGDHVVVRRLKRTDRQRARIGRSACDQCTHCTELCPRYLLGHPIEPHRAMRSLGFTLTGVPDVAGTAFCCECNLCSMIACPEDLDPRDICAENKRRLAAGGKRWKNPPLNARRAALHLNNRRTPTRRLMQKLGLTAFTDAGPLAPRVVQVSKVSVKLKQHAGAPCEAVVAAGQAVRAGDVVGRPPQGQGSEAVLGAPVHASIDGTVAAVDDGAVYIVEK